MPITDTAPTALTIVASVNHRPGRRHARVLAATLAGVVALAACGGSGDQDSVDVADPPTVATTPAVDPEPTADPSTTTAGPAPDSPTDATPAGTTPAPSGPTVTSAATSTIVPTTAPVAVPEALDFAAPLVTGGEIELGEYAGRPVLLWFWAPW